MDSTASSSTPTVAPPPQQSRLRDHPLGFWFFFWGEFAERCSYYGMRAILLLYMTERLGFSDSGAGRVMSFFIAACYFLPLVGGYLADRFFGRYAIIVTFSLPYILGHVILGIENVWFLFIALALLAMGSGVIKPNISTLMGLTYDQQRPGQTQLRSDSFALFYGAINIGAAISSFALPAIRTRWGYAVAFLFPAALMVLAFAIFAAGKPFYAKETVPRVKLTPDDRRQRVLVIRRILGLFLVVAFFWSIFDQSASTWTLFARDGIDLNVFDYAPGCWQHGVLAWLRDQWGVNLLGVRLDADQIQGLNPILIVLLLPGVTLFWHFLTRLGWKIRPTDKMLLGFVLTGLTMAIMSVAGFRAETLGRVSVLWEVLPYILITVAEICISVVGLELAFTAAPPEMKSFITACWLLTVFVGNMLNSFLVPLYNTHIAWLDMRLSPGAYFGLFALATIPVTLAFLLVARRFNRNGAGEV